eukprot:gene5221-6500_t
MNKIQDGPVIVALVYPGMISLDLFGPLTSLATITNQIHLVWESLDPVQTDTFKLPPNMTFDQCLSSLNKIDVVIIPGGMGGSLDCMTRDSVQNFLKSVNERTRYMCAVCTGTVVLGATGLLRGKRATTHWYLRDMLNILEIQVPTERKEIRVCQDGKFITGSGVTAGVDFGLTLVGILTSDHQGELSTLILEYTPQPPYNTGDADTVDPTLKEDALEFNNRKQIIQKVTDTAKIIASHWHNK